MSDAGPGSAGSAFLNVVPVVAGGTAAALAGSFAGPMKAALATITGGVGAMVAASVAGIGAIAIAGLNVAGELGKGQKTIRLLTGETGKDLEALGKSMRNIVGDVAGQGIDKFAEAIGRVRQRTDLAGPALERLATAELRLAKLTGEDLSTTIESTTRMFGDWSIATDDQVKSLDFLFHASQATGVGINQLSQAVVKYGAPFRQLGFSFEDATALIGKFEKEGVNTGLVLGSMRVALGKMARAGEEPVGTFRRLTGEIKDAGDSGKANAIALELFGARAGPDMAAAIREGRFEIGNILDKIRDTPETLEQTEKATRSWSERMGVMFQRSSLWLEPIGKTLITMRTAVVGELEKVFEVVSSLVEGNFSGAAINFSKLLRFDEGSQATALIVHAFESIGLFVSRIRSGDWAGAFSGLGAAIVEAGPQVRDALLEIRDRLFGWVEGIARSLWSWLGSWVPAFAGWAVDAVPALVRGLAGLYLAWHRWIIETAVAVANRVATEWVPALVDWVGAVWPGLAGRLGETLENVRSWITDRASSVGKAGGSWSSSIGDNFRAGLSRIGDVAGEVAPVVRDRVVGWASSIGSWLAENLPRFLENLHEWASAAGNWLGEAVPRLLESAGVYLGALGTWIIDVALPWLGDNLGRLALELGGWVLKGIPLLIAALAVVLFHIGRFAVELAGPLLLGLAGLLVKLVGWLLLDALPKLLVALASWAWAFVTWIPGAIVNLLGKIPELLGALGTWLIETGLPVLGEKLLEWGGAFAAWVPGAALALLGKLGELLGTVGAWIIETALPAIASKLIEWSLAFVMWVIKAMIEAPIRLAGLLFVIGRWILFDAVPAIVKWAAGMATAMVEWVNDAIRNLPGNLLRLATTLISFVAGLPERINAAARGMWNGIGNAFVAALNWVVRLWNNFSLRIPEVEFMGQKVGGFGLDTPNLSELPYMALGGRAVAPGLAVVGEQGAEIVRLAAGDSVFPLERALTDLAGRSEGLFRDLVVNEAHDPYELLELIDAQLGWRLGRSAS